MTVGDFGEIRSISGTSARYVRVVRICYRENGPEKTSSWTTVAFIEERRWGAPPEPIVGTYLVDMIDREDIRSVLMYVEDAQMNQTAQRIFGALQGRMDDREAIRLIERLANLSQKLALKPSTCL